MWTKKSYDALYNWIDKSKRAFAKKILLADGLDDVVNRLEAAQNMGDWYNITQEAAKAVGDKVVEQSATEAEAELNKAAAALGRKGGSAKTDAKQMASRENGKKGGRPANKWTTSRIKRALSIIDVQDKCNVVATTEKSQRMADADFLRTYRKNLSFDTQEDFREYVEMSRTQEISFLLNRLS